MQIALDISDLSTARADGTTRYVHELAARLPKITVEHEWQYLAPSLPRALPICRAANVSCLASPWPYFWTQSRLALELYKYRPDVLFMPIQQLPLLRSRQMKTIAVVHDLAVHKYPAQFTYKDWALLHLFSAHAVRQADEIIAVSQATADDIDYYYGRTRNVHVVHHGVDHQKFYPATAAEHAAGRDKLTACYPKLGTDFILFVGQIQPRKNITGLVAAFEILQRQPKYQNFQLVIAGSHGWLQQPILDRINKSAAREKILLLGRVPDDALLALYQQAQVFVLPSFYEGFGMPLVEAMAAGCAVVASNTSSMPEVVGSAGILIDPNDAESISAGIRQALQQKEHFQQAGLARAKQFTWDRCAQLTHEVITSL